MTDIITRAASAESIIHCGAGSFELHASKWKGKQIYIVTDSNVFAIYRHLLWNTFGNDFSLTVLPAGEHSKNPKNLIAILKDMLSCGMKRGCVVIAFGGGVVGDIAGLAASLYMRGCRIVQIPTTLLSQVDSSVGGKTAVDIDGVKNAIGSFYQPEEVIVDPRFLQTLTDKEIRCGLGEIIKYGALDKDIYNKILNNRGNLKDEKFLGDITADCIRYKAKVVEEDERDEKGIRKALNLGHTTGHAFELYYRKKSHGEFVLIGMYYEMYIARKYGICGGQYADNIEKLIKTVLKIPAYEDVEKAAEFAAYDKKNDGAKITLIVPKAEGESAEMKLLPREYAALLAECRNSLKEIK